MTFKEYLATRKVTDTPPGDFTRDARGDRRMPDATSWAELREYIERTVRGDMVDEVLPAAKAVWAAYRAKLKAL